MAAGAHQPSAGTDWWRAPLKIRCLWSAAIPAATQAIRGYGGFSAIIDPWGETLALAAENEQILTAECEMDVLGEIRSSINVFRDRRPELYHI